MRLTTAIHPQQNHTNPATDTGFIVLVAPARSYRVASYIHAADSLGLQLLIVSDSKHSLIASIANGITIDFSDTDAALNTVLSAIRSKRIVAVIATDDRVVTLSSRLAEALGLPHNAVEATRLTYRKDLARQRLREKHCNVPEFRVCAFASAKDCAHEIRYPVVLKPLMLSGSRGVLRADTVEQFVESAARIQSIVNKESGDAYEKTHFLVEGFLQGEEVAIDGFVQDGQFIPLALFDKPEPLNGPCFEESYYITPSRHSAATQRAIMDEVEKCCHAYGLTHGPIHAEARICATGIYLIEMASRTIGGQCAQLIEYALGRKLEEVVIQLMCQQTLDFQRRDDYAGVLMIPIPRRGILRRVEGLLEAQQTPHITQIEIHIQPGYELIPLPEGASYLGFIFASAASFESTWRALREAHSKLNFVTRESWTISVSG